MDKSQKRIRKKEVSYWVRLVRLKVVLFSLLDVPLMLSPHIYTSYDLLLIRFEKEVSMIEKSLKPIRMTWRALVCAKMLLGLSEAG